MPCRDLRPLDENKRSVVRGLEAQSFWRAKREQNFLEPCQEKINNSQKVAYFRAFSEVGIRSLTSEKARLFYMETYLLRKCVSGCDLGLDNAN